MYQFLSFNIFLVISLGLLLPLFYSIGLSGFEVCSLIGEFFMFDSLSFYTLVLVVFLGLYTISFNNFVLDTNTKVFLIFSLFFTGLCFCVNHSILFWCIYELSMLPLLFLIFRDSPYSERFLAGWYFTTYLALTSLPLILILLFLSYLNGSFVISDWGCLGDQHSIYVLLAFVFFTKVPLCPFHTWLPIVHAEATSVVSIFLSGYIMKLGILGVYRCSAFIFDNNLFVYLVICCVFSVFFLVTACSELDGKRWLALLSLSHIVVPFLGFFVCNWDNMSLVFLFCLGHGLSAGIVFGLLWFFYDSSHTRNWVLVKSSLGGSCQMFVLICGLLSLCSFPPTLQFFCEVNILKSSAVSLLLILYWSSYLFFGGLVPLTLCGHTLLRSESTENSSFGAYSFVSFLFILSLWCYLGIILL